MIPDYIEQQHILQAIERIDAEGFPYRYRSTKFDLVHNGNKYPPKYVVSLSHIFINGQVWSLSRFSGGEETNRFLTDLGFTIVKKSTSSYWWVNHKQTHKEELSGGYIWSPKKNKNGAT